MKQILGKIIFLILFLSIGAFGGVTVSVSSPAIYKGDMVNYIITADGGDIEFPNLSDIGGYTIRGTASSSSINIINGTTTRTISKTYSFRPDKSLTIPSYTLKVDGKEVHTKELKVEVLKPSASKQGQLFVLEMQTDKNETYVGEPINLTISFKRKLNAHAQKLELAEPKLENFWVKKIDGSTQTQEGGYIVETIHYKLFAQKSGEYHIPALTAMIGQQSNRRRGGIFDDPFFGIGQQLNWQKIYSNELKIKVNALPNGVELYGNYAIEATVDKETTLANKPVNLTITIKGEGNIDDVKKFNIDIDNVIVYADEPKISSQLVHNIYQGEFSQKIALIADRNFVIPSLNLEYFDKKTKSLKTISTNPIKIKVKGGAVASIAKPSTIELSPSQTIQSAPTIKQEVKIVKEDGYVKYLFLILGFAFGLALSYGINRFQNRKPKQESNMVKAIRKAKDDKALFNLLLPYAKEHSIITDALDKLERNIYRNGNEKIDREELMEVFELDMD